MVGRNTGRGALNGPSPQPAAQSSCSFSCYVSNSSTESPSVAACVETGKHLRKQMEKRKESHGHKVAASGKRKRKAKHIYYSFQLQQADTDTIFALLLAALSNLHKPMSVFLIKKCLSKIRPSILSETSAKPILALLPALLNSNSSEIMFCSAEIISSVSLASFEMNKEIASDSEIVKGLILLLGSSKKRVLMSACNAVLDLSTTTFGRQQLLDFSALEKLMLVFLQIPKFSNSVSLCSEGNRSVTCLKIKIEEDELPVSVLNAAIILINASVIKKLQTIPQNLSEVFLTILKELWEKVREQMVLGNNSMKSNEGNFGKSNIRVSDLAESLFRLSISASHLTVTFPLEMVERSLFSMSGSNLEDFVLNYWEVSPFLLRRLPRDQNKENDIFSPFIQSLNWTESVPSFISSTLQGFVSCLPIASDEVDILNFLNQVKDKLGCPIIYQQDIRVVRTGRHFETEVHYFQDNLDSCCIKEPFHFNIDDYFRCGEAYKEGYTVALRGIEFRYQSIAAIADTLAFLIGQPSVGANLYLTPPNSQGLARHFDDHCVFVCQLFGSKQWKVFSRPSWLLPRLYDPLHSSHGSDVDSSSSVCREFCLREGDILYIPRGYPHEAHTRSSGDDDSTGFSLHLTLGVEVEPPFEWEGFAHFALHFWNENQKKPNYDARTSLSQVVDVLPVNLLHIAIGSIGNSDPTFRKACLAAAISSPSDAYNWLALNQRNIFAHVIDKIYTDSKLPEVVGSLELSIQKNEDPFQRIRWLQLLHLEKETTRGCDWGEPFVGVENLLSLSAEHKDEVEVAFLQVKSRFCSEVVFGDIILSYKMFLEKYRKTRRQYMNGMVALHHKL
ncbi:Lysine-specific demethylase NO66 [Quillaja saponaria]|uniref:Bifunctional lysine-specific demethylase and histidyl-hydroxylase n=1 Tax=Quillaja saponaria TaxID=32244 RepID=A0AAD7PHJ6_QUISA|nr:Lysine-specific demethylase NO66 [Quillaja saponaria]